MIAMDEKLPPPERGDDVARRTFESLANVRGFRVEPMSMSDRATVSIEPMPPRRSFWRHNGMGKWNARDAVYEKVEAMKMTSIETDREKSALMKDLHELGLKHGLTFVVVARPIDGKSYDQEGLLIDHKDDTSAEDVYTRWLQAGIYLIQATNAVEEYIAEQRRKEPS